MDGVGRAYDPRPDKLRRTGREASGLPTRGAWSPFSHANKFICTWGKGAYISTPFSVPVPAPRGATIGRRRPPDYHTRRRPRPDLDAWTGIKTRVEPAAEVRAAILPKYLYPNQAKRAEQIRLPMLYVSAPDTSSNSRDVMAGACGGSTAAQVLADLPAME